jgi:hypothetical protein
MKSTRQVFSAGLLGFLSLYLLFGVLEGTLIAINDFAALQSLEMNWFVLITGGILSGILLGGAIGYALSCKNKVAMMAICGLAHAAPRVLLNPEVLGFPNPWMDEGWASFLLLVSSPFSGFVFGMLVGLLWRGWKAGIAFGLASAIISTTCFWINRAAQTFVLGRGVDWIFNTNTLSAKLWVVISWMANSLLYGVIVAILWSILLDRYQRRRPTQLGTL